MDAQSRWPSLVAVVLLLAAAPRQIEAGGARTENFVVHAPTPELASEIARSAERWRRELAIEWLGEEMPPWGAPCPINASVSPGLGAGGETSFVFDRGEVFGWRMRVQGSRERVLDSVLPHEITHTVFATHFRRPLPRWADEGACTTVEHRSEVGKQERMLIRFLKTGQGIPFDRMFAMKEYPPNVMPLYSQGHSLATFLIERRGKAAFIDFLADGMADERWNAAVRDHYGHRGLRDLQESWMRWVWQGRPRLPLDEDVTAVAANTGAGSQGGPAPTGRGSVYAAMGVRPRATPTAAPVRDASRGRPKLLR